MQDKAFRELTNCDTVVLKRLSTLQ